MSAEILTTAERWRRYQRDLAAYRRRSLWRRSHARFRRDLAIIPHVFLLPGRASMSPLIGSAESILEALRGQAIWTLDTATRLASGHGFLTSPDLTGYLDSGAFQETVHRGLIGLPQRTGLSVDPLYKRPPMLIVHAPDEPIPWIEMPTGDRVVPWDFLAQDLLGTLGWRPDLLDRLEAVYPANPS